MIDEFKKSIDTRLINGSDLAYIGDAYYELYVRCYLLHKGITKPNELHKLATKYVQAESHALIVDKLMDSFDSSELDVFHRGRNYNYRHHNKNGNMSQYLKSSGFEALIGYLYINNNYSRLEEIMGLSIKIIEDNLGEKNV